MNDAKIPAGHTLIVITLQRLALTDRFGFASSLLFDASLADLFLRSVDGLDGCRNLLHQRSALVEQLAASFDEGGISTPSDPIGDRATPQVERGNLLLVLDRVFRLVTLFAGIEQAVEVGEVRFDEQLASLVGRKKSRLMRGGQYPSLISND